MFPPCLASFPSRVAERFCSARSVTFSAARKIGWFEMWGKNTDMHYLGYGCKENVRCLLLTLSAGPSAWIQGLHWRTWESNTENHVIWVVQVCACNTLCVECVFCRCLLFVVELDSVWILRGGIDAGWNLGRRWGSPMLDWNYRSSWNSVKQKPICIQATNVALQSWVILAVVVSPGRYACSLTQVSANAVWQVILFCLLA